ncbi:hypothetical protein K435DRAFT_291433 [Dendrothele bispora CBS 962.96]|uniref:Secreted protein n=1 Tax=Dendrothele bispora (strain CBS 962.96) TaxID=1314807 RepID=A0A4S8LK67_DENBC|nr:hypothetical protein K435DRAFT_291433 [Dendrothele bispora CBS 962.96]
MPLRTVISALFLLLILCSHDFNYIYCLSGMSEVLSERGRGNSRVISQNFAYQWLMSIWDATWQVGNYLRSMAILYVH